MYFKVNRIRAINSVRPKYSGDTSEHGMWLGLWTIGNFDNSGVKR